MGGTRMLLLSAAMAADCDTVCDDEVSWNGLRQDSFSEEYREPFSAVPLSVAVTLSLQVCADDLDCVRVWDTAAQQESWGGLQ